MFSSEPTQGELLKARVFEEPLVPIGTTPTPEENGALARVVNAYVDGGARTMAPVEAILEAGAVSPYRASLLLNLGLVYVRAGRPSRALRVFREAWAIARSAKDPLGTAVGDRALAELVRLLARSAEINELNRLLADIQGRDVRGPAGEVVQQGREAAYLMATQPDTVFRCGPLALQRLLAYAEPGRTPEPRLLDYRASHWGISLGELQELSKQAGLDYQMAKRVDHSSSVVVPAVVHWNLGHFAALVAERDGKYLILDPVFNDELWISREALNDEMSGYALVPRGALPRGWREVPPDEAKQVWGRGLPSGGGDPGHYGCGDIKSGGDQGGCKSCSGMARYAVHSMLVSLNAVDTPVGYAPPRGPAVNFTVTYNQRESLQPQIVTYWNLGPMWTTDWLAWVTDDPTNLPQPATVYMRGGGYETYTGYNSSTSSYAVALDSRAVLVRVSSSPIRYERRLPNGSVEEYAQPDGAVANPRKVFLTRVVDPQGNSLSFTYDSSLRLVAVVDSLSQVTTLSYELPADPLKVTKVTDPFGRFATFSYNASGRLAQITDVIGLQSGFEYGAADFISALVTPYGRTTFTTGTQNADRWVVATDPIGGTERVEYRASASLPTETAVPQGFSSNQYMNYRNTFYWDKRSSSAAGDYTKAHLMHWLHAPDTSRMSGTLESEKRPLENRVWYAYPGQTSNARFFSGTLDKPIMVARVLDDGSTQTYQYEYNFRGLQTKETDPIGRETVYVYGNNNVPDANPTTGEGMDLLQVKRKNGATYDLLRSYTYNDKHQPLTITDARVR